MNPKKEKMSFLVSVFIERDNGEYHAFSPALKGLHTCGKTKKEVLDNTENAIIAYLSSLIKHGDPIPLCIIEPEKSTPSYLSKFKQSLIEVTV